MIQKFKTFISFHLRGTQYTYVASSSKMHNITFGISNNKHVGLLNTNRRISRNTSVKIFSKSELAMAVLGEISYGQLFE